MIWVYHNVFNWCPTGRHSIHLASSVSLVLQPCSEQMVQKTHTHTLSENLSSRTYNYWVKRWASEHDFKAFCTHCWISLQEAYINIYTLASCVWRCPVLPAITHKNEILWVHLESQSQMIFTEHSTVRGEIFLAVIKVCSMTEDCCCVSIVYVNVLCSVLCRWGLLCIFLLCASKKKCVF